MIVTCLIGYPTEHSFSPKLFDIYSKSFNLDYSHIKINVLPNDLEQSILSIKLLGFVGANITLPYKTEIMKYCDEIDEDASLIGAVNTIKIKDGRILGYNTDMYGATRTIEETLGRSVNEDDSILILGTGGASRAICTGLLTFTNKISIAYRDPKSERTKGYFKDYNNRVSFINIENLTIANIGQFNIICNATSAGMHPDINTNPLLNFNLRKDVQIDFKDTLFFDAVFNPQKTQFLSFGEKNNAKYANGVNMMIYQGIKAFKLWTDFEVQVGEVEMAKQLLKNI